MFGSKLIKKLIKIYIKLELLSFYSILITTCAVRLGMKI